MAKYVILFFVVLSTKSFAQTNVNELNNKIKALEATISEVQLRNAQLKKALDLKNSGTEIIVDSIKMRVTQLYRDKADNSIYVKGLITYLGEGSRALQFSTSNLISPSGGQYAAHSGGTINNLNDSFYVPHPEKDTAYGFMLKFADLNEEIPTVSLLTLRLYGSNAADIDFKLKGLDVKY